MSSDVISVLIVKIFTVLFKNNKICTICMSQTAQGREAIPWPIQMYIVRYTRSIIRTSNVSTEAERS